MNPSPLRIAAFLVILSTLAGCSTASRKANSQKEPPKPSKVSKLLSSMIWKYQMTPDKKVKLGRKGQDMSIETLKSHVQITAPNNWKVVSCMDDRLNWDFVATAPDAAVGFGIKVVSFPGNPKLDVRFQNYLAGIRQAYDGTVQMAPEAPFVIAGKQSVPSYLYYSSNWGTRLVIMMPQGDITTVVEFIGPSAAVLHAAHAVIQKILNTYTYRKL
ncbi:MAG: hypothetical protein ABIP97_02960 [Chthoniobacterales bacterium]